MSTGKKRMKIHKWNQTKAHTKKHNKKYVQDTHMYIIKEMFSYFGYYYCSNGQGVRASKRVIIHMTTKRVKKNE